MVMTTSQSKEMHADHTHGKLKHLFIQIMQS